MDRKHVGPVEPGDDCRVCGSVRTRERAIAALASRQHGVVTRKQLFELGLSRDAIDNRLKAGRLHALLRGVYLLGHSALPAYAHEMAAVLACGPSAVVSHRSAAQLSELLPYPAHPLPCDVTVWGRHAGRRPEIRLHRVSIPLDARDIGSLHGIPVTRPARTLLDMAALVTTRELERALAEAHARRMVSRGALEATLGRAGRTRGAAALRRLLEGGEPALTRSEAEGRLLDLIRRAHLPPPAVNVRIGRHEVDFLWRAQRLVVEVDGFQFHSSRAAFERDRLRDAELQARGLRVMRVTWRQIVDDREATLARIAQALVVARRAPTRAEG